MAFKEHQEVLERIRGQTVQLSDFRPLFTDASNNINPHYLAMIPIANGKLEE